MRIILASSSARRKKILAEAGLEFETVVPQTDETCLSFKKGCTEILAAEKADSVASRLSGPALVIAADTMVVLGKEIFGKPEGKARAQEMLSLLSGKFHEVYTGLCVMNTATGEKRTAEECTRVLFRDLSPEQISAYIESGEPFDKAGAYGIQGKGRFLVDRIEGCFFNVVGLPIGRLYDCMKHFGYELIGGEEKSEPIHTE